MTQTTTPTSRVVSLTLVTLMLLSSITTLGLAGASGVAGNQQIGDGERYWTGEQLEYDTGDNDTYTLYRATSDGSDEFIYERQAENNTIPVDTDGFEDGEYYFEDSTGTEVVSFFISQQSLNITASDTEVANQNDGTTSSMTFDSNRASYYVTISAEGLTTDEVLSIFSAASEMDVDDDSDMEAVLEVTNDYTTDADFAGVDTGEYAFNFTVVDTGQSVSETVTVTNGNEQSGEFTQSVFSAQNGERVPVTVSLTATDSATVELGSDDVNYNYTVDVTDQNDDGEVTFYYNSHLAGEGAMAVEAGENDSVAFVSESSLNQEVLDANTYDLSLMVNGEEDDVGALALRAQQDVATTALIAPSTTSAEMDELEEDVSPHSEVALGDNAVIEMELDGLSGYVGSDVAAADLAEGSNFAMNNGIYVTIEEENEGPNTAPNTLDPSKATLVTDQENNRAVLVFSSDDYPSVEAGDMYNVTLHVTEANPYVESEDETQAASTTYTFVERTASISVQDDDQIHLVNDELQSISGDTTVAPNTEVQVVLRSTGDSPFLMTQAVVVGDEQSFRVAYDLSSVSPGTNFTAEVQSFSEAYDGVVEQRMNADFEVADQRGTGESVMVDNASLSTDGFLVVENADGEQLGATFLEAGDHSNIEVGVSPQVAQDTELTVTAYADTDGDQTRTDADEAFDAADTFSFTHEPALNGSVEFSSQEADDGTVTIDSVTASNGGFVVVNNMDGEIVAVERIEPGTTDSIVVETDVSEDTTLTAQLYYDENGDGTFVPADDSAYGASAVATVGPSMDDGETPDNSTDTGTDDTATETPGQPGFGAALAVVALAGAALLALWRN